MGGSEQKGLQLLPGPWKQEISHFCGFINCTAPANEGNKESAKLISGPLFQTDLTRPKGVITWYSCS